MSEDERSRRDNERRADVKMSEDERGRREDERGNRENERRNAKMNEENAKESHRMRRPGSLQSCLRGMPRQVT